ncbi:MAG: bifunctional riboflavin kinase/FAD synthetase [Actinomycetota bacterium]|nr:bifunctional riboflavin kinase/FAD synthetase [Actinomycetota bacterium]
MQLTTLADAQPRPRRVAVGEFDGVHLGHRRVIAGSDTVLTFEPHPLAVIRPEAAPKLLTSLEAKATLIEGLGVQELVVIPFDQSFAAQTPQAFIDDVLIARLQAEHVSVGENFRFGHRAAGDTELLAADRRFGTSVVEMVEFDGEIVSSSHIRALVLAGDVGHASRFLGAPFSLRGEVVTGDRRGRTLGFPTANLIPDERLVCPGHGVYAARADGACAAVSVGVRPTFGTGRSVLVEAYLLDREVDLYGQLLTVEFLDRLRGERRFESVEALVAQMHDDVRRTRGLCG